MTMKLLEMRELQVDEIAEQVSKSKLELINLRMKFTARQLEDSSLISKKRKEIARLLTIQREKSKEKKIKVGDELTVVNKKKNRKTSDEEVSSGSKSVKQIKGGSKKGK